MLFFYSRSNVVPEWIEGEEVSWVHYNCLFTHSLNLWYLLSQSCKQLLSSPYFFFDAFYTHEKPSKTNNPQVIYDFLSDIERPDENNYVVETHSSLRRIYLHFTLLLANPLQRPEQV